MGWGGGLGRPANPVNLPVGPLPGEEMGAEWAERGLPMKAMALCLVGMSLVSFAPAAELPGGWLKHGSDDYQVGVDTATLHEGRPSGYVRAVAEDPRGFATLMRWVPDPGELRGHRVRLSAWVRSENIDGEKAWAGLWFRIDGPWREGDSWLPTLGFDNMSDRPIKGTIDWVRVEIVLDVPGEARGVAFGVLLAGSGQVWLDHLKFELVGQDVPVTGRNCCGAGEEKPNLEN